MKTPLLALLALSLTLAGCGAARESRLNPFNWFGRCAEGPATLAVAEDRPGDHRPLVAEVVALEVNPTPGGAIVTALGQTPTQGWWAGELVADNRGEPVEGVLTYRFHIAAPHPGSPAADRVSTPQSREVTVAVQLSNIALAGVRRIVVTGAGNSRAVSR